LKSIDPHDPDTSTVVPVMPGAAGRFQVRKKSSPSAAKAALPEYRPRYVWNMRRFDPNIKPSTGEPSKGHPRQ